MLWYRGLVGQTLRLNQSNLQYDGEWWECEQDLPSENTCIL